MLPPTLIASLKHIGTPIRTPTGTMSPVEGYKQFLPNVPVPAPVIAQQQPQQMYQQTQVQPMMMQPMMAPMAIPQQQQIPPEIIAQQQQQIMLMQQQMIAQTQSLMQQQQQPPQIIPMAVAPVVLPPSQPPMMTNNILSSTAQVVLPSKPPLVDQLSSSSLLDSLAQSQPTVVATGPLPAAPTPTPPASGHASRSMSFSEKAPSVPESPTADWAIPQSSKLKYTQLFNATDKTRSGFLTGTQARGILLQTKVAQQTLAQIWAMSDRDADGRLGCEEFVLALYLCEMVATGKPLPAELPPDLIPPSFRKAPSRVGSVVNSRHGSVSSQGNVSVHGDFDPALGMSQGLRSFFFPESRSIFNIHIFSTHSIF